MLSIVSEEPPGPRRLDLNLAQHSGLLWEFLVARRKVVEAENVRQDVDARLTAQLAWVVCRHCQSNSVGQLAHSRAAPIRHECAARQTGRFVVSCERRPVARRAQLTVKL